MLIVLHHTIFRCIRKELPEVGPIVSLTVISYGWTAPVVLLRFGYCLRVLYQMSPIPHLAGGVNVLKQPLL